MTFVADACALIAFHGFTGETMSDTGREAMKTGDVAVCPITVWEITRKIALGKLARPVPSGFNGTFSDWLRQAGYRLLPMTWDNCECANALPMHHKDPMDRMLIALAVDRGHTVITDDEIYSRGTALSRSGSRPTISRRMKRLTPPWFRHRSRSSARL